MTESIVLSVIKDAIYTAIMVSAPILVVATVVGLIISIFQATTQIQEQTLTFVPKLVAVALIGLLMGSWMLHIMLDFTTRIFALIANMGG
ncbi:flagellar biosynthesis protein FliQ [Clostridium estertheticum]|uniref:flagellar biosynthesis protein FliQ n=1 Tax=Clostridium estertheticum TaxID=238834 RepID=UPI001C7DF9E6|nr:flagellar biosynthesis protein FliQ [Clostridium estertheticum]MBX4265196.1 flagellar biosynthesis protein FliQ [Clostridium estertheticum]MBX4269234.1 flagellar biosynthesis protein FliQ [Clostridium estertheticum]MCB2308768.1 flagellar biosynthesis protein FliQ [Clostridium estertheticum]MCB2347154.1 flagellar biosynthesis protein FliQ [Clostridium estertheticum]MCB2351754.1 flagellar biosynthesis protein FliQ [Clostridium estertheticum]